MKKFRNTEYYISEDGCVFRDGKQLKPYTQSGYKKITLYVNKEYRHFRINRLVAELYIPNHNNLPEVDHKDGNKVNNHYSNLEWVTSDENKKRALYKGKRAKKLTEQDILWIRKNYIPKDKIFGCNAIAKKYDVDKSEISKITTNKIWKHI